MEVLKEMVATLRGLCNQVSEKLIQATSALVLKIHDWRHIPEDFFSKKKQPTLDETLVSTARGGVVSLMDVFFFQGLTSQIWPLGC